MNEHFDIIDDEASFSDEEKLLPDGDIEDIIGFKPALSPSEPHSSETETVTENEEVQVFHNDPPASVTVTGTAFTEFTETQNEAVHCDTEKVTNTERVFDFRQQNADLETQLDNTINLVSGIEFRVY